MKSKKHLDMKRILTFCSVLLIAATAFAQAPRYGLESGSYKMETNVMGQTVTSTIYFDDFGAKEATSVSMMGVDMTQILKDGKVYVVDKAQRSVQEMPQQQSINYMDLTEEVIAKNKIQEIGTETVDGKDCTVYTLEMSQMGQTAKATVYVWQGFAMKTTINTSGITITTKIVEINEGPVDASIFEIPEF